MKTQTESSPAHGTDRAAQRGFDALRVRADFPILSKTVHGKPLVYLDNAASSQKPAVVIDSIKAFYENDYSNIHRSVHELSARATKAYEATRAKVRAWIGAAHEREIVFVRGTTEAINLVAATFGRRWIGAGDEILVTGMEHHSNIVPWQMLCETTGAVLRHVPVRDDGTIALEDFDKLITAKTKLVAVVHISNTLGTVNPVREIIERAHAKGARVLLDGAQAAPHVRVDVRALDCDFYAFSSHKMFGPTGIGVLYGKAALLEEMPPYQGGGDMISSVTFEKTTYNEIPYKFEAGTQNIADVVGLGAAIDYLDSIDFDGAEAHEQKLLEYASLAIGAIPGVRLIGTAPEKASIVSFVVEGIHPHDVATGLDVEGIAIRGGHHCTQPLMTRYGIPATARASFAMYNTMEDADRLVTALQKTIQVFR
jgi:cysteine desulfurase / selenocysteine lyase